MYALDVCVYRYISINMWREREMQMGFPVGMGYVVHRSVGDSSGDAGHRERGGGAGGTTLLPARWRGRQLHPFWSPFPFRPRRMSGSPSGRSWLWAVSSTMARDFTPAAARAASRASPPGKPGGLAAQNLFGG